MTASTQQNEPELRLPPIDATQILEKIILGGIIFILALPLLGDYGLWLFPIGRDVIFRLAVELLSVSFLLTALLTKREFPPLKVRGGLGGSYWIVFSLLALWAIMFISTLTSVQPEFSLWGNIYKNQGLLTWTHYLLFFFLLTLFLRDKKQWQMLINWSIAIASLVSLVAVWQMLEHDFAFRAAATLNNSNFLAAYLVLITPVTFAVFLLKRSWWLGSAAVLQFFALLFTQTRGGYLGMIIAVSVFAILYFSKENSRRAKRAAGVFLATGILIGLIVFTPLGQKIQSKLPNFADRFLSMQSIKGSSAPRLEAWRAGWQGILDKPLLGYGPENFFVAYDTHYNGFLDNDLVPIELSPWEAWFDKAHNFIFDIGATTGLLGLFAYIVMFFLPIWLLAKRLRIMNHGSRVISVGLIAALTGYLTQNLLGFDTTVPGIYLMLLLAYSVFLTQQKEEMPIRAQGASGHFLFFWKWLKTAIPVIGSIMFVISLRIHIDILKANHELNLAEGLAHSGQIEQGFAAFEKGLAYDAKPISPNLRRRYAVIALAYYDAVQKKCPPKADPLQGDAKCAWLYEDSKKKLARALELQEENSSKEWPRFTRNYIYAAQITHILEKYEESDIFFKKALELSPERKSIQSEWDRLRRKRD